MTIGTKSILYGAHCFLLHPFLVAAAWSRLYGFPYDLRLWVAFFVHDLGYFGCGNMDGTEGEDHVHLGANLMRCLFGQPWEEFTRCHSRFWAKRTERQFSRLCVADKLAFVITPLWLYLPMTRWTGELPGIYAGRSQSNRGSAVSRSLGKAVSQFNGSAHLSRRPAFVYKALGREAQGSG